MMMACISVTWISCNFSGKNALVMGLPSYVPVGGDSLTLVLTKGGGVVYDYEVGERPLQSGVYLQIPYFPSC